MERRATLWGKLLLCVKERRLPWISRLLSRLLNPYENVTIETSSVCNIRCVWCVMYYHEKKDAGLLSLENFKKFIDLNAGYLKKKKMGIYLQHRGEALLNKDLFAMARYAKENGVIVNDLHTNLSLAIDITGLMESAIPEIIVNIGGTTKEIHEKVMRGSNFELVTDNLRKMFPRNKYRKPVFLKMNITKDNLHQIKDLPVFFKNLGGDPRNAFTWNTQCITPAEASKEEKKEFLALVASEEAKKYLKFAYDPDGTITAKKKACLYIHPCIRWNGLMSACCQDKLGRFDLGQAFVTPLQDILNSKEFKAAVKKGRRMGFWFCKDCN